MADADWPRRIRAAAAYAGLERQELARKLGMSDSTLRRKLAADLRPHERRALLSEVAELCGLPYEFFTVDFARLPELTGDNATAPKILPVWAMEMTREIRNLMLRQSARFDLLMTDEDDEDGRRRIEAEIDRLEKEAAERRSADEGTPSAPTSLPATAESSGRGS